MKHKLGSGPVTRDTCPLIGWYLLKSDGILGTIPTKGSGIVIKIRWKIEIAGYQVATNFARATTA